MKSFPSKQSCNQIKENLYFFKLVVQQVNFWQAVKYEIKQEINSLSNIIKLINNNI